MLAKFVGVAALTFCGASWAVEYQLESGQCRFEVERDGTFWMGDLPTDNYMRPACSSIAIADKWKKGWRLGWRVALLNSTSIQARDNIALPEGAAHIRTPCTPPEETGCYSRFNGQGWTQGISFSATYEQPLLARLSATPEVGIFFFQHHFKAEATHIDAAWGGSGGRHISYNETSKIWDLPAPLAGLTIKYALLSDVSITLSARHYWSAGHRQLSLTNHSFNQLSAGIVISR